MSISLSLSMSLSSYYFLRLLLNNVVSVSFNNFLVVFFFVMMVLLLIVILVGVSVDFSFLFNLSWGLFNSFPLIKVNIRGVYADLVDVLILGDYSFLSSLSNVWFVFVLMSVRDAALDIITALSLIWVLVNAVVILIWILLILNILVLLLIVVIVVVLRVIILVMRSPNFLLILLWN